MDVGIGIALATLGAAAVGAGRRILERRKAHRQLITKPVLDAMVAEGTIVRVTGVVRVLERTLEAPLSGVTCVVARSRVSEGGAFWWTAIRPRETLAMVPFVLDCDGGPVSIEGEHVLLDLPPLKLEKPRGLESPARTRRERFLLLHGVRTRQRGRSSKFWETVVEPGMTVSVAGLMMKDAGAAPSSEQELGFRDAAAPALRLAGNVDHPLVIGAPVDLLRALPEGRKQLA